MFTRQLLPILATVSLIFALVRMTFAHQTPPPATPPVEPAKSPFAAQLAGAGILEPETENISVGTHVGGVIDQVHVQVGQTVSPGDPLFRIDDRAMKAELAERQANLDSYNAALQKLRMMPRPEEIRPIEAKFAEAEANLADQKQMYDRFKKVSGTAVSEEELTRREMSVAVASAQLARAKSELELVRAGSWKYDLEVAVAASRLASAQLERTKTELERLTVRAPRLSHKEPPTSGTFEVLQVNVRPGEFVGTVPGSALIVLGYKGKFHLRIDIDESEIERFRPGLEGIAKPRGAVSRDFPIRFVRVEPYVIPKRSLTGGGAERVDTRVLQVIYSLEKGEGELYVGQQMDAFLNVGK